MSSSQFPSLSFPFSSILFPRYERFVREGGDADLALYFESLVPNLLAYLDPDLDPDGPKEDDPLRERRSGADRAGQHKREKEAKAIEEAQDYKMEVSSKGTIGFQVPLLICY